MENDSPAPSFESDDERTSFLVRLPARAEFSLVTDESNDEQVGGQDTTQYKLMKNKENLDFSLDDTAQDDQQVSENVKRLVTRLKLDMSRAELQKALELDDPKNFRSAYLNPALDAGFIEMTLPGKPTSKQQRYRLTSAGESPANQLMDSDT